MSENLDASFLQYPKCWVSQDAETSACNQVLPYAYGKIVVNYKYPQWFIILAF